MDIGSVFLILALFLFVIWFVARPFLSPRRAPSTIIKPQEHERSSLLAERDRVLNALQELDFDYTLGKVPEDDYPNERNALLQRGAEILRQLDALNPQTDSAQPFATSVEDRIEMAIAERAAATASAAVPNGAATGDTSSTSSYPADDPLEVLIATRRRERQESSAGFCPQCGTPVQKSDRFCAKCGYSLE